MGRERSIWSRLDAGTRRHLKAWAAAVTCLVAAVVAASLVHPPFKVFVLECLAIILGVFSTPIFFETSLFLVGVLIVLAVGALRMRLQKPEWVEFEPEARASAESPSSDRFASPGAAASGGGGAAGDDELEVALAVVEGYLELGLPEEAWDALVAVPRRAWDASSSLAVRLRTYALTRRWREGEMIIGLAEATDGLAREAASYHVAHARALVVDGVESGESPSPRAARKAAAAALRKALRLYPDIAEAIESEQVLKACVRR